MNASISTSFSVNTQGVLVHSFQPALLVPQNIQNSEYLNKRKELVQMVVQGKASLRVALDRMYEFAYSDAKKQLENKK